MIRSISVSRPTTGSSLPSAASLVKLRPNWSSSWVEVFLTLGGSVAGDALAGLRAGTPPRGADSKRMTSLRIFSESASKSTRMRAATPSFSRTRPSRMCSVPMKLWPRLRASRSASSSTFLARGVNGI